MIISVGYRVSSKRGVQFRQWATKVLKDYMLKGYAVNQRLSHIEQKMDERFTRLEHTVAEHGKQIDFFVRTSLPRRRRLLRRADIRRLPVCRRPDTFGTPLARAYRQLRGRIGAHPPEQTRRGVTATIYTARITPQLQLDLDRHNDQYPPIDVRTCSKCHDRFLIIDNRDIYHIGASLKDLGRKMFAFSRLTVPVETITDWLR